MSICLNHVRVNGDFLISQLSHSQQCGYYLFVKSETNFKKVNLIYQALKALKIPNHRCIIYYQDIFHIGYHRCVVLSIEAIEDTDYDADRLFETFKKRHHFENQSLLNYIELPPKSVWTHLSDKERRAVIHDRNEPILRQCLQYCDAGLRSVSLPFFNVPPISQKLCKQFAKHDLFRYHEALKFNQEQKRLYEVYKALVYEAHTGHLTSHQVTQMASELRRLKKQRLTLQLDISKLTDCQHQRG